MTYSRLKALKACQQALQLLRQASTKIDKSIKKILNQDCQTFMKYFIQQNDKIVSKHGQSETEFSESCLCNEAYVNFCGDIKGLKLQANQCLIHPNATHIVVKIASKII